MARATLAEVDDLRKQIESLEKKVESLETSLDLETNRADRATKALRHLYTFADISAIDSDVDGIELENTICQILGYQ